MAINRTSQTPIATVAIPGSALAKLHHAARGYDAPARSTRLLASGFTLFNTDNPQQVLERIHPEDRDWAVNFCVAQSKAGVDHEAANRALSNP